MSYLSRIKENTYKGILNFLTILINGEQSSSEGEYLYTRKISFVDVSKINSVPKDSEQLARKEGFEMGKKIAAVELFLRQIEKDAKKIGIKVSSELDKNQHKEWIEAYQNISENIIFVRQKLNTGNLDVELSKRLLLLSLKNLKEWNKKSKSNYFNCKVLKMQFKNVIAILDQIAPKLNSFWSEVLTPSVN